MSYFLNSVISTVGSPLSTACAQIGGIVTFSHMAPTDFTEAFLPQWRRFTSGLPVDYNQYITYCYFGRYLKIDASAHLSLRISCPALKTKTMIKEEA